MDLIIGENKVCKLVINVWHTKTTLLMQEEEKDLETFDDTKVVRKCDASEDNKNGGDDEVNKSVD